MPLDDSRIPTRLKLFALWTALMFCYVYGDYFQLYQPGKLQAMLNGRTDIGPVSQQALLSMSLVLAIPALMTFLSLVLPPPVCRWANIVLGAIYTLIMLLAIQGAWQFYIFFGVIEMATSLSIVWYAWRWPKDTAAS